MGWKTTKDVTLTPRNVDDLMIAADIVLYHFLQSHRIPLVFQKQPSCETNNKLGH